MGIQHDLDENAGNLFHSQNYTSCLYTEIYEKKISCDEELVMPKSN